LERKPETFCLDSDHRINRGKDRSLQTDSGKNPAGLHTAEKPQNEKE
jgi:hypothetical protein